MQTVFVSFPIYEEMNMRLACLRRLNPINSLVCDAFLSRLAGRDVAIKSIITEIVTIGNSLYTDASVALANGDTDRYSNLTIAGSYVLRRPLEKCVRRTLVDNIIEEFTTPSLARDIAIDLRRFLLQHRR